MDIKDSFARAAAVVKRRLGVPLTWRPRAGEPLPDPVLVLPSREDETISGLEPTRLRQGKEVYEVWGPDVGGQPAKGDTLALADGRTLKVADAWTDDPRRLWWKIVCAAL